MNDNPSKPTKRALMDSILMQGMTAIVDFAPQAASIPEYLKGTTSVQLKFDNIRCREIFVGADGVSAAMTFGGRHHSVFVPWAAVYCISFDVEGQGPRGVIYQESIPEEVVATMVREAKKTPEPTAPKQASLQGGAKIYDLAEARARKLAREQGGPRRPAG